MKTGEEAKANIPPFNLKHAEPCVVGQSLLPAGGGNVLSGTAFLHGAALR